MRKICIALSKGGVAKSSTAVSLASGLAQKKNKAPKKVVTNLVVESVSHANALAKALLKEFRSGKTQSQLFWSLSRIGAREPLYGSVDRVVPPKEVSNWVRRILKIDWKKNDPVSETIVQLVRKTNDRTRDIDPEFLNVVLQWLSEQGVGDDVVHLVKTRVELKVKEQGKIFGESLPAGLVLKNS